jgi:hypothetical protein
LPGALSETATFKPVTQRYADYCCFDFAPFVERLLSGFLLSDAPGSSFEAPLVPVDVPLAPEFIEPVSVPTDLEGLGVGFELDAGFPPCGAVSAAKAGAAANSAATPAQRLMLSTVPDPVKQSEIPTERNSRRGTATLRARETRNSGRQTEVSVPSETD